jgi:hypothetical protein
MIGTFVTDVKHIILDRGQPVTPSQQAPAEYVNATVFCWRPVGSPACQQRHKCSVSANSMKFLADLSTAKQLTC